MTTWQRKIGKRLMEHVRQTTVRYTLAEVRENVAKYPDDAGKCWGCARILQLADTKTRRRHRGKQRYPS